jgi:hypothetical protein
MGRPGGHEPNHFGDVGGCQRRYAGVDRIRALLVAVETDQRELGFDGTRCDLGESYRLAQQLAAQRPV